MLKSTDTGTEGGEVWPAAPEPGAPPPPAFFFFFFFFFFLAPPVATASPPSSASPPDSAAASSSTLSFSSICAAASAASSAMTRGSEPVAGARAERDGGCVTSRRRSRVSGCAAESVVDANLQTTANMRNREGLAEISGSVG